MPTPLDLSRSTVLPKASGPTKEFRTASRPPQTLQAPTLKRVLRGFMLNTSIRVFPPVVVMVRVRAVGKFMVLTTMLQDLVGTVLCAAPQMPAMLNSLRPCPSPLLKTLVRLIRRMLQVRMTRVKSRFTKLLLTISVPRQGCSPSRLMLRMV